MRSTCICTWVCSAVSCSVWCRAVSCMRIASLSRKRSQEVGQERTRSNIAIEFESCLRQPIVKRYSKEASKLIPGEVRGCMITNKNHERSSREVHQCNGVKTLINPSTQNLPTHLTSIILHHTCTNKRHHLRQGGACLSTRPCPGFEHAHTHTHTHAHTHTHMHTHTRAPHTRCDHRCSRRGASNAHGSSQPTTPGY